MEWRKSEYKVLCNREGKRLIVKASGYTCELVEGLTVGITNKLLDTCFTWRPAGFWTMSILPEGLIFKTFKTKRDAQAFIEKEAENLKNYVADYRRRMNHGSVDAAHEG